MSLEKKLSIILIMMVVALLCVVVFLAVVLVSPTSIILDSGVSLGYSAIIPDSIDVKVNFMGRLMPAYEAGADFSDWHEDICSIDAVFEKNSEGQYISQIAIPTVAEDGEELLSLFGHTYYFNGWYLHTDSTFTLLYTTAGDTTIGNLPYDNLSMVVICHDYNNFTFSSFSNGYRIKIVIDNPSELLDGNIDIYAQYSYYLSSHNVIGGCVYDPCSTCGGEGPDSSFDTDVDAYQIGDEIYYGTDGNYYRYYNCTFSSPWSCGCFDPNGPVS
ncbi:MAG: hypothetical protein E7361_01460 [Clostridiales bacterium]|nr:hypothetical protein [Clostridiales bacterium]